MIVDIEFIARGTSVYCLNHEDMRYMTIADLEDERIAHRMVVNLNNAVLATRDGITMKTEEAFGSNPIERDTRDFGYGV